MLSAESHALFRRLTGEAQRFVLATHLNPDGDAIGSEISLARFLRAGGKETRIINGDPTPETLRFVDPRGSIEAYRPADHDPVMAGADLVVLLDNSAPDRLGRMEQVMIAAAGKTLCIDHHPTRDAPWAHNIVDAGACATAGLVFELTHECGWIPDAEAAQAMYVGLATDTGFFRFNSTNARAHAVAAELVKLGAEPARTYREIHERNSEAYTRLLGHALAGLRVHAEGAVASVELSRGLIGELHAEDVDASEITTALLAMDGVRVAVLFRELHNGRVKVSLRSKGDLDVHDLAAEFGGGGHRNASGIVLEGSMNQVAHLVTERAAALLAERSF